MSMPAVTVVPEASRLENGFDAVLQKPVSVAAVEAAIGST